MTKIDRIKELIEEYANCDDMDLTLTAIACFEVVIEELKIEELKGDYDGTKIN